MPLALAFITTPLMLPFIFVTSCFAHLYKEQERDLLFHHCHPNVGAQSFAHMPRRPIMLCQSFSKEHLPESIHIRMEKLGDCSVIS